MGVYVYNADGSGNAPTTKTNNSIVNNTISNSLGASNVSGNGNGSGYQVGILDLGNHDNIVNNKISGSGYDAKTLPNPGFSGSMDLTGSTRPHSNNN